MCSDLLRSQVQLVNMVSHRFSDSHYGMPTPSWPYTPYYSPYGGMHPPPGSDPQSLQPSANDYMQKLQQYHAALQEAHYRLMSQQSGPSSSVEEREQGVGPVPPFSSRSVNLPPPPPPPAGLFGASPPTFNFAPRGFPFQPSSNASHSNNIGLMQEERSPLGRSHLAGPANQVHHHHPRSPSGVTADSMQVVAPSSPQSAYASVRPMQEGEQEQPFPQSGESSSPGTTVYVSSVLSWENDCGLYTTCITYT